MLNHTAAQDTLAFVVQALNVSVEDARTIAYDVAQHPLTAYRADKPTVQDAAVVAVAGALRALAVGYDGSTVDLMNMAMILIEPPVERKAS